MIHSTAPFKGVPKKRAMVGRLILTMEESSVAIKMPTARMANTTHLLGCSWLLSFWAVVAPGVPAFSPSVVTLVVVSMDPPVVSALVSCCFIVFLSCVRKNKSSYRCRQELQKLVSRAHRACARNTPHRSRQLSRPRPSQALAATLLHGQG